MGPPETGGSFEEVFQKACRMINPSLRGETIVVLFQMTPPLVEQFKRETDTRLFAVQTAFELGYSVEDIYQFGEN
jgi:carbamoyl-phosphate synthase/aspartate carbamoyltransferase